jgi:hypothetical protein
MNESRVTRKRKIVGEVEQMWDEYAEVMDRPDSRRDEKFQRTMYATLAKGLTVGDYEEAIVLAMAKDDMPDEDVYGYFCGIIWNKAKGKGGAW